MNTHTLKLVVKISLIVGLICFFCPFAMVSCAGSEVELSGVELMTKIPLHEDVEFADNDIPNVFLMATFVAGIVGLACACNANEFNKKMLAAAISSVIGAAFLIIFSITLRAYYPNYSGAQIETRWGWTLSLIAFFAAATTALFYNHYTLGNDVLTMSQSLQRVFSNFANFKGRARRNEYWNYWLFTNIINYSLVIAYYCAKRNGIRDIIFMVSIIFAGITLIPKLAVSCRRLHDIGRSGWWYLLMLIPIVGPIILIVWLATDSKPGGNKYGANPKNGYMD